MREGCVTAYFGGFHAFALMTAFSAILTCDCPLSLTAYEVGQLQAYRL